MRHILPVRRPFRVLAAAALVASVFAAPSFAAPSASAVSTRELWTTNAAIWQTPKSVALKSFARPGVHAVMIDGDVYRGRPTRFFAYYALPSNATAQAKVPGIVLVHGGGGTAFDDWVRTWNARGYAAIAMDTCGGVPPRDGALGRLSHRDSGPDGWGRFDQADEPLTDQWTYHAVATAIRAHSFLRSLPEVDASRIGVTGISWGGYLTACIAGVDGRFAFAAPVYGCAFLRDHSVWSRGLRGMGGLGARWDALWDARNFLPFAKMPMLWCTGTNDHFFPLDSLQRGYDLAEQVPSLSIKERMPHGHPPAGDPPEITAFADSIAFGRAPLPKVTRTAMADGAMSVEWEAPGRTVAKAFLVRTDSADANWEARPFVSEEIAFSGTALTVAVPPSAVLWYVNLVTDNGLVVSTRHFTKMPDTSACGGVLRVSPDGLSPQEALQAIRAAKAKGDSSAWTVKVAPGRYVLSEPLVMRPEDSGTPSAPVRWVAEEGGEAVFAGGGRVAGWRDDGDGTWSAPVPKGVYGKAAWFQSLYVNGRRAVRSRHPNAGFFHVDSEVHTPVTNAEGKVTYVARAVVKDAAADVLTGLSPDELAAVELQARVKWSYGAFSVAGWSPADRTLTVKMSEAVKSWKTWAGEKNLFCFENVRAGFDAPGEWLYDKAAGRIRYRPRPGETLAALEAYAPTSGLASLLCLEGEPERGKLVTDISFEGISFELSTLNGERLPSGFVQQYQGQAATRAGGCVYAKGAQRVTFDRCRVAHTENYAVRMDVGCVSNRIVRCEMTDLGAGGVFIGDVRANYFKDSKVAARYPFEGRKVPYGDPRAAAHHPCAFITVDDCTISDAGLVNPEGCGVLITQASDCSVTHCDIGDLYYTGVSVGWTWGYSGSLAQRNTVAFNRIHDIGKGVMSDMGGVYTLGTSFGTCVSNNVICNVKSFDYGGWGLYNDEGSEGVVWENNLVHDVKDAAYHQHYGRENVVRNNVFVNAEKTQLAISCAEVHRSVTFDRNVVCWTGDAPFYTGPYAVVRVKDGNATVDNVPKAERATAGKVGWGTNLVWRTDGAVALDGVENAVVADPLFADAAKGDFRLKEGSPALKIGFVPWDYARSGRRTAP